MDAARWERLQALFHDVVDRTPAERLAFLRGACADDPALIDEVLAAVAEDEQGDSLLDQGVEYAAERMIAASPERLREIGPYRLIRTIGEGGMGVVFLAERTDLGTSAAVKPAVGIGSSTRGTTPQSRARRRSVTALGEKARIGTTGRCLDA